MKRKRKLTAKQIETLKKIEQVTKDNPRLHNIPMDQKLLDQLIDEGSLPPEVWLRVRGVGKNGLAALLAVGLSDPWVDSATIFPFSTMTNNALYQADIRTDEQLRRAFQGGRLMRLRNYGAKAHAEVMKYLGIPDGPGAFEGDNDALKAEISLALSEKKPYGRIHSAERLLRAAMERL